MRLYLGFSADQQSGVGRRVEDSERFRKPMLYPLSYEGRGRGR
jgi:hypothetical protein